MAKVLKKLVFTFCFLVFVFSNSFSQISGKIDKQYLKSYWKDGKKIIHSPVDWKILDFWKASFVIGSIYFMTTQDERVNDFFRKNKNETTKNISKILQPFGNEFAVLGLEGCWYAYGLLSKNKKAKQLALTSIKTTVISGIFVFSIKHLSHRSRPFQNQNPREFATANSSSGEWGGPGGNWEHTSFVSGHAAFSFGLATIIANSSESNFVRIGAYSLAVLIAVSRIHDEKHWRSDVIAGAVLGIAIAKNIYKSDFVNVSINPQGINISKIF